MPVWTPTYSTSPAATYVICPQWTTSSTTSLTWTNTAPLLWNITTSGTTYEWQFSGYQQTPLPAYEPPSREELDRIAAEQYRFQRERLARVTRRAERAEALLASLIDEDQMRSYLTRGWFEVTGSSGGRYRINRNGQAGNVDELAAQGSERVASLCIHPYGGYHDADAHAAQFLALVTDEEGFRRTANRTPRRRLQAA